MKHFRLTVLKRENNKQLKMSYHPMSSLRIVLNWEGPSPLVAMSASCSLVEIHLATMPLSSPMCDLKKWYFKAKYLLRGDILGTLIKARHDWLSSNTVDLTKL